MYQVILFLDETRNKSYYYSYKESEDTTLGNITCTELPPYQDINKARSCYWDAENLAWVFDEEKYAEIMTEIAEAEAAREEAEALAQSVPTTSELAEANVEMAIMIAEMYDAMAEIAEKVATLETKLNTEE